MAATLEELERRVDALEQSRPADLRRAVEKLGELLEDTRQRMSTVEIHLEGLRKGFLELTAHQAEMRGELRAEINAVRGEVHAVRNELKTDIAGLRRDMPGIVAEAMREVLRNNRG